MRSLISWAAYRGGSDGGIVSRRRAIPSLVTRDIIRRGRKMRAFYFVTKPTVYNFVANYSAWVCRFSPPLATTIGFIVSQHSTRYTQCRSTTKLCISAHPNNVEFFSSNVTNFNERVPVGPPNSDQPRALMWKTFGCDQSVTPRLELLYRHGVSLLGENHVYSAMKFDERYREDGGKKERKSSFTINSRYYLRSTAHVSAASSLRNSYAVFIRRKEVVVSHLRERLPGYADDEENTRL